MAKLTFKITHDDTETYTDIELTGTISDDSTATKQLRLFKDFLTIQTFSIKELAILNEDGEVFADTGEEFC